MPLILHQPRDRRSFLKTSALGLVATVVASRLSTPRTAAAEAEGVFHLALLSDTHVPGDKVNGHRGFNPWENLRQIVPDVVEAQPEGTIVCGDVARLEGKPEDYAEAKALLQPLAAKAPVYFALGNHDHRDNFLKAIQPADAPASPVSGRHVLVIEHAVARIVILDSLLQANQTPGLLGKGQRTWLADFLTQRGDRPVVLFVHHTLGDADGELLDSDRLFAAIRPHRHVKAIFFGHSHVWELGERDGVRLINLPAVGYNFADQQPVGWVDARFRSEGVALTLHAFGGNRTEDGRSVEISWG